MRCDPLEEQCVIVGGIGYDLVITNCLPSLTPRLAGATSRAISSPEGTSYE
jgi:hypothetical protein